VAALVGTLPIALGLGAGAKSRQPLGIAVVGGLLFSQIVTLYVTPVLYTYFDALQQRITKRRARPAGPDAGGAPTRRPRPRSRASRCSSRRRRRCGRDLPGGGAPAADGSGRARAAAAPMTSDRDLMKIGREHSGVAGAGIISPVTLEAIIRS
jgi:hypothetical protein